MATLKELIGIKGYVKGSVATVKIIKITQKKFIDENTNKWEYTSNNISNEIKLLCNGRLANAWGLGGLHSAHSKLVYALDNKCCK